jgi:drug/metabolite transporter (DMT)-like permease
VDLPLSATLMVLAAAVAHATWNAIAHDIKDEVVAFVLLGLGGMIGAACVLAFAPMPRAEAWPYLVASVVMHVVYTMLLMTSYRLGEFSQAYPLARGTSPLIVTVLAAVFIGEVPGPIVLIGVVVISVGLGSLTLVGGRPDRHSMPAVYAALATGLAIATYSTIDGAGVRTSGTAAGYTGWLILLESSVLMTFALVRRGGALVDQVRPHLWMGTTGGILSVGAYGLVLWAQTRGALAPIAALRESSIIVGALIGTVFFHERFGRPRVIATVVVFVGIVLVLA